MTILINKLHGEIEQTKTSWHFQYGCDHSLPNQTPFYRVLQLTTTCCHCWEMSSAFPSRLSKLRRLRICFTIIVNKLLPASRKKWLIKQQQKPDRNKLLLQDTFITSQFSYDVFVLGLITVRLLHFFASELRSEISSHSLNLWKINILWATTRLV